MKHNTTYLLLYFVILSYLLVSCSQPKAIEYRDFKNFKVGKLGFSTSAITMDLIYYNPNNVGLQLKRTELDVYLDNKLLGHSSQDYQISIPEKDTFSIPIRFDVDMKNLASNGLYAMFKKEVMIKMTGSVKVGKANVFINFPINYEGKQSFSLF